MGLLLMLPSMHYLLHTYAISKQTQRIHARLEDHACIPCLPQFTSGLLDRAAESFSEFARVGRCTLHVVSTTILTYIWAEVYLNSENVRTVRVRVDSLHDLLLSEWQLVLLSGINVVNIPHLATPRLSVCEEEDLLLGEVV